MLQPVTAQRRCQADQLVTDIELREDWRISREDCVLLSLNAVNIDTASQRT